MTLSIMLQKLSFRFLVGLLLASCGCTPATLAELPGSPNEPAIVSHLKSPLVAHAEMLTRSKPASNHVKLLEIGDDALLSRIHLIRSARKSITIQTMIWANDETGRLIIYELIQAARRGVAVQLLIDHLASEQHIEVANFLAYAHPNFQVKLFNPVIGLLGQLNAEPSFLDKLYAVVFSFNRLNQRMHNKTFIVDELIGIAGGRNYQNAYYDKARAMNYKDRDLLVVGPVVREMKESFDCYWEFERSISITELADVKRAHQRGNNKRWHSRDSFLLNGLFDDMDLKANQSGLISQLLVEPLIEVSQAYFIADDPQKRERPLLRTNGQSKITQELADLVSQAKQSVYIQTPYLVLTSPAISLFKNLRKQHPDIDIRISTNSLAATDSWYVYALSYKQKKTYLSALNFKIYEFKPLPGDLLTFMPGYENLKIRALNTAKDQKVKQSPPELLTPESMSYPENHEISSTKEVAPYFCMHGKSLVVDGSVSFVGSYNLDPRSENINTESGLIIRDRKFSRILKGYIETDMKPQNSWVIARKNRLMGVNETNAMFVELSNILPLVDVWPFRYSASFELREGKAEVDVDHPDFHKNYRDVGSFPQVGSEDIGKEVGARGTKAFLGFVKPLL